MIFDLHVTGLFLPRLRRLRRRVMGRFVSGHAREAEALLRRVPGNGDPIGFQLFCEIVDWQARDRGVR